MEKTYSPQLVEKEIADLWDKGKYFEANIYPGKKPFTIILPLPNANDSMHIGHIMFTVEDIMIRYHRMAGEPTLWLPGADHAGIETQFVFEKKLTKEGKSRFDFDRETLYQMIWDFVEENRALNKYQLKTLGYSLDWSRYHYSLEPAIVENVLEVFRKLYRDGLVYRANRIVNYCTYCGTAFSDLEIDHPEKDEFLYYLNYGAIKIATTRPETIFADVAVAVNPKDKKYKSLIGQKATIPLINKEVPIIADEAIEIGFGTNALKVTPAHDQTDYEIGLRHNLPVISCINLQGKMINVPERLLGMPVSKAKEETINWLTEEGKLIKTEPLHHTVSACYKCNRLIEPLPVPQWYVKTKPLAEKVIKAVGKGETKFFPVRFKKTFLDWLKAIRDWNISRQIVWGPRIPAWYCLDCQPEILINFIDRNKKLITGTYRELKDKYSFAEITKGLQSLTAPVNCNYLIEENEKCPKCGNQHLIQETDTFDTWFLSGQWPLNTLGFNPKEPKKSLPDFEYFYPTSVMDTLWDILFFWVARMMMFGLYLTNKVPFKLVHLHSRVVDEHGKKMSKSKGNVANPSEIVEKYGADALRMALIYGTAPASDIVVSESKIISMRNFANKLWNASRFVLGWINTDSLRILTDTFRANPSLSQWKSSHPDDQWILAELDKTIKMVTKQLESYRFGQAAETVYDFFWHTYCDRCIEMSKPRLNGDKSDPDALITNYQLLVTSLKLIHPFMPFVTEKIWQQLPIKETESISISKWPKI